MLLLIEGGEVYAPEPRGRTAVLIDDDRRSLSPAPRLLSGRPGVTRSR